MTEKIHRKLMITLDLSRQTPRTLLDKLLNGEILTEGDRDRMDGINQETVNKSEK